MKRQHPLKPSPDQVVRRIDVGFDLVNATVEQYRAEMSRDVRAPLAIREATDKSLRLILEWAHGNRSAGSRMWQQLSEQERNIWRRTVRGCMWPLIRAIEDHVAASGWTPENEPPAPPAKPERLYPPTRDERDRIARRKPRTF
jgi:hypothetical protein